MKQPLLRSLLGGALLLMLAVPLVASPGESGSRDGRDGPPRGPSFDGPPHEERGPSAKGELMHVWHDIAGLEGTPNALSKAQAAQVVALVVPISKNQTLSDDAAKTLADQLDDVLTDAQRAQIDEDSPRGPRDGGPRDGPPNGPPDESDGPPNGPPDGRGGPPDGPPPLRDGNDERGPRGDGPPPRPSREEAEKIRAFMDALNPFYAPTAYASFKGLPDEVQQQMAERWSEDRDILENLSRRAQS